MNQRELQIPSVIRLTELVHWTGKSKSSIYSDMERDLFPKPVSIDLFSKGWIRQEVGLWLFDRWQERDRLFGKQFSTLPTHFDELAKMPAIQRLPFVVRRTGKSRSAIYTDISKGLFPRPVRIGVYAKGWIDGEIDLWIFQKVQQRVDFLKKDVANVRAEEVDLAIRV